MNNRIDIYRLTNAGSNITCFNNLFIKIWFSNADNYREVLFNLF